MYFLMLLGKWDSYWIREQQHMSEKCYNLNLTQKGNGRSYLELKLWGKDGLEYSTEPTLTEYGFYLTTVQLGS